MLVAFSSAMKHFLKCSRLGVECIIVVGLAFRFFDVVLPIQRHDRISTPMNIERFTAAL